MTLARGSRLGPYEILEPIASGGMGDVYRARDGRLSRDVALKVQRAGMDEAARALFAREAHAVAALSHPGILAIHDVGTEGELCWAALELLEGETLRARLSRGPLPWSRAVAIAEEIADALEAAHAHGIVHRDLKPENVFVTAEGHAKLLDFGLAQPAAAVGADDVTASEPGLVSGTAGYMAPEQVRGETADARSDVFAFGCVLYEMLTGKRAFGGGSAGERLAAVLTSEPEEPPERAIPAELRRIVMKCLEKERAARFQDAGDLVFALRLVESAPAAAPPRPRAWRRPALLAAAGVAAIAALLFAGPARRASTGAVKLAVLPFSFPAGDPDAAYLGDGVAERLINALAPLPGVRVIARMTAFELRGESDPKQVGRRLAVDAVVTGNVRRHGDVLEVQADLVDARDGAQLWGSGRLKAEGVAAVGLPEEIARGVARRLDVRLSPEDDRRLARAPTTSANAWDLYLKGRFEWNKRTPAGIARSIDLFSDALRADKRLALAWAGLAQSYDLQAFYGGRPPREALPKVRDAALRALALDPGLAEAEATVADIRYQFDWDWKDAEQRFVSAIASSPSCATAHQWYSNLLSASGRFPEAEEEIERAWRLDPLNFAIDTDVGLARYWAGSPARAEARLMETLALKPLEHDFPLTHLYLGLARLGAGRPREAIAALEAARRVAPDDPDSIAIWGYACTRAGRTADAREAERRLEELSKARWVSAFPRFLLSFGLGEREAALTWLEKACEERAGRLVYLNVERAFDPLRAEPRFAAVVRKVAIPSS